tara:strand:- start:1048 stop:1296 length:249 start_codon:yes stop_codon:yes gene_type:complete
MKSNRYFFYLSFIFAILAALFFNDVIADSIITNEEITIGEDFIPDQEDLLNDLINDVEDSGNDVEQNTPTTSILNDQDVFNF